MASLDATVVNVALPHIGGDLDADVTALQWVLTGYLLGLASFILLGGALGDRLGRRRVFLIGTAWFAGASLLCGVAPSIGVLVATRILQGVGGALLTPGSMAILQASFRESDRAVAVGAWSALGGVAGAIGPFVGGSWWTDPGGVGCSSSTCPSPSWSSSAPVLRSRRAEMSTPPGGSTAAASRSAWSGSRAAPGRSPRRGYEAGATPPWWSP